MADARGLSIRLDGLEEGTIVSRPNRFIAVVRLGGEEVLSHVADSGRLKELIFPGNAALVRRASPSGALSTSSQLSSRSPSSPSSSAPLGGRARVTSYDLVLARQAGSGATSIWVSVDTRYPNRMLGQALNSRSIVEFAGYESAEAEYWYHRLSPWKEESEELAAREARQSGAAAVLGGKPGNSGGKPGNSDGKPGSSGGRSGVRTGDNPGGRPGGTSHGKPEGRPGGQHRPVRSRMDFFLKGNGSMPSCLVEVKSVTLCRDGVGFFPDAPTGRGVRHLRELARGAQEGYAAFAVFIAQREDVEVVRPNREMDPAFADAMKEAQDKGVRFLGFRCSVSPAEIRLDPRAIPVDVS